MIVCISDHIISLLAQYLINACWNFTKFSMLVQFGTKMISLQFEVQVSKVKVTARPNVLFWWRHIDGRFSTEDQLICVFLLVAEYTECCV